LNKYATLRLDAPAVPDRALCSTRIFMDNPP
jgi:hypothetical protein